MQPFVLAVILEIGRTDPHLLISIMGKCARRVDLGAGDDETLTFQLEPTTVAKTPDAPDPVPAPEPVVVRVSEDSDADIWVAGISTVVLGGATATLAILTASAQSELETERGRVSTEERLRDLSDDVKLRALLTDVGLGLTAASAVLTAVLWLTDDERTCGGVWSRAMVARSTGDS